MNHILIHSRSEEGNLNRMREMQFRVPSAESELEVQKTLICLRSREGTAESSRATRFSNTFVDVQ